MRIPMLHSLPLHSKHCPQKVDCSRSPLAGLWKRNHCWDHRIRWKDWNLQGNTRNGWTEKCNWVLWSDDLKFELFGPKRHQFVCRKPGEHYDRQCLRPTFKHGGGCVTVWGCISDFGVGKLVKMNGTPAKEKYKQILQHHIFPRGNHFIGRGFIFQQHNDPKHTSNIVKQYLENKVRADVL